MGSNISEFPKHPLPHVPPAPEQPQRPYVPQPTVLVYEKQRWEYRTVSRSTAEDPRLVEEQLNALGNDGWELVGVVQRFDTAQFYLKRARD